MATKSRRSSKSFTSLDKFVEDEGTAKCFRRLRGKRSLLGRSPRR